MVSKIAVRQLCFSLSVCLALFTLLQVEGLEAKDFGINHHVEEYEGAKWNGVYFDIKNLSFRALIPQYSGGLLSNDDVSLTGAVPGEAQYIIITSVNGKFSPPKTEEKFVQMIQIANHTFVVGPNNYLPLGARFGADLSPKSFGDTLFWRFLVAHDRLIKMGTDDPNANRRQKFFDSIKIK